MQPTEQPPPTLLRAALTYTKAGWPVFPLQPGTKVPYKNTRGFKDATRDPARVHAWWSRHPDSNIGTPTGVKVDVLDVDVRQAGDGFDNLELLIQAGLARGVIARAQTRNAGEQWFYPAAPTPQPCTSIKGEYIDIKAAGGYVVLPPSRVPADEGIDGPGVYSWIEWNLASPGRPLDGQAIRNFLQPRATSPITPITPGVGGTIAGLVKKVSSETEGNRNNVLFWAVTRAISEGLDLDPLRQAAIAAGLTPSEVAATISSARRRSA